MRTFLAVAALAPALVAAGGKDKKADGLMSIDRSPERYSCHPGFVLEGNMCVQWLEAPLETSCLRGEGGMDGRCALREPALVSCPGGFAQVGGRCLSVDRRPLEPFCLGGDLMQAGGFCSRSVATEPLLVCPLDRLSGKKGNYGGKMHGGKKHGAPDCSEEFAVNGTLSCSIGELVGDQCLVRRAAPCPVYAEKKDKKGGKKKGGMTSAYGQMGGKHGKGGMHIVEECSVDEYFPAELLCPPGSSRGLGGCVEWRPLALTPFCADGVLNSATGMCEALLQQPAQRRCPAGFQPCGGGKKTGGKKQKGKKVYSPQDCCRTDEVALLTSCPQGTEWLGGMCVSFIEPHSSCPYGYTFYPEHGICKQLITKPPIIEYTVNIATKGATYGKAKGYGKGKK